MIIRLFPMLRPKAVKKLILASLLILVSFLLIPHLAFAQAADQFGVNEAAKLGLGGADLKVIIARIVQIFFGFLGIIAVLIVMYGGFIWMTAGGDVAKIEKAKKLLVNAVIGLVIIFSAFAIVSFVINALLGNGSGGNGRGTNPIVPGSIDDWGRSAIGAGPIESVYPAPGQKNVPINTSIVVTFKMEIKPETICGASACSGSPISANIAMCQTSATSSDCAIDGGLTVEDLKNSTVTSQDNKTFVFSPSKFLGQSDNQVRQIKVLLKKGILAKNNNESILNRYKGDGYSWMFQTNGKIDLDPPKIISAGILPYYDDEMDGYSAGAGPSATRFNITVASNPRTKVDSGYTQPVSENVNAPRATLSGVYGGLVNGTTTITIQSNGKPKTVWPAGLNPQNFQDDTYRDGNRTINLGPFGLTLTLSGQPDNGTSWDFYVTAKREGDRMEVWKNGRVLKAYLFDNGANSTVAKVIDNIVADFGSIFKKCATGTCLETLSTGDLGKQYDIKFFVNNTNNSDDEIIKIEKIAGHGQVVNRNINGVKDVARNQVIQINFNKAINPEAVTSSIFKVKYSKAVKDALDTEIANTQIKISNQYKTIEILPPALPQYECGQNACGETMYCWPVNALIDTDQDGNVDASSTSDYANKGTKYEVNISAASLRTCSNANEGWCTGWGGACAAGGTCSKTQDGKNIFYPASSAAFDGIMDLAGNSFNGNFSTTTYNSQIIGSSEGKSGTGAGFSGKVSYNLNVNPPTGNIFKSNDGQGDDFKWSYWMSDEVDRQPPLISTISPVGDAQLKVEEFNSQVVVGFDRPMRSATLKPGWNYGDTAFSKSQKYIVLSTLSKTQNPVGYWTANSGKDINGDGVSDYTEVFVSHNRFDANIKYGPLFGSGIQSLSQNCYLPGAGPNNAGEVTCSYDSAGSRVNCAPVANDNPASYAYMYCNEIMMDNSGDSSVGVCDKSNECKVSYYLEADKNSTSATSTNKAGSWIITKDYSTPDASGKTGCCFGKCVSSSTGKIIKFNP